MTIAVMLGLVVAAMFVGLSIYLRSLRPSIFWLQVTFTEGAFRAVYDRWSAEGRRRFASHFTIDYVFVVAYAAFGAVFGGELSRGAVGGGPGSALLPWLLPVAALGDVVENRMHQRILAALPGVLPTSVFALAGLAATAKWLLIVAFVVMAGIRWMSR